MFAFQQKLIVCDHLSKLNFEIKGSQYPHIFRTKMLTNILLEKLQNIFQSGNVNEIYK